MVHNMLREAAKTGNIELMVPMIHPLALGFLRESQFVAELKPSYGAREILPALVADMSRFMVTSYGLVYRVAGDTAIVCGTSRSTPIAADPNTKKKGPERFSRVTFVYTKTDQDWKLLSWHNSEIPLKK